MRNIILPVVLVILGLSFSIGIAFAALTGLL